VARPRDETIDRKVVDACVALLQEHGRAGLSRARIAARAGVSLPAVNRRFADVEEILLAVARTPGTARDPEGSTPPPPEADSLRAHLVGRLTALARTLTQVPLRRSAAEILAAAAGDPRIDEAFQATLATLRADGLALVARAQAAGEVAEDVDGELLLDLVTGSAYYRLLWRGRAITEREVEQVVDLVLRGAAPTPNP